MRGGGCFSNIIYLLIALIVIAIAAVGLVLVGLVVFPDTVRGLAETVGLEGLLPTETVVEPVPTQVAVAILPELPEADPNAEIANVLPTYTPLPVLPTNTPEPTNTRRPTAIPSITPTFPPATATSTATATPTPTGTAGPSPTATQTRSSFLFTTSEDSPIPLRFSQCDFLGIGGEVLSLDRNPVPSGSYLVHVWGNGIDQRISVGTWTVYGSPSGWLQVVGDAPAVREYNVQLETPEGTPVSQVYAIQTRATCNENLIYVIFVQNH